MRSGGLWVGVCLLIAVSGMVVTVSAKDKNETEGLVDDKCDVGGGIAGGGVGEGSGQTEGSGTAEGEGRGGGAGEVGEGSGQTEGSGTTEGEGRGGGAGDGVVSTNLGQSAGERIFEEKG